MCCLGFFQMFLVHGNGKRNGIPRPAGLGHGRCKPTTGDRNTFLQAGEMLQRLRELAALLEDQSSVPSAHIAAHKRYLQFQRISSGLRGYKAGIQCTHMNADKQINAHMHKIKQNKNLKRYKDTSKTQLHYYL